MPRLVPTFWRLFPVLLLAAAFSGNARAQQKPDASFVQTVAAKFFLWDTDRDQALSEAELDAAIENPGNTGRAAAALAALKRAARSTNYTLPPLTLANIRKLANSPPATNRPDLLLMYDAGLKSLAGMSHRLIFAASQLFPSGPPKLDAIRQGHMGDCFCLAPLGAMVHRSSQEAASLFEVEADGHVLVKFGGGGVFVDQPTPAEFALAMLAPRGRDGLFVNLYEKAIGRVDNLFRSPEKQSGLDIDAISKGGSMGRILSYLTGHRITTFPLKFGHEATAPAERDAKLAELRQKMAESGQQRLLMAAGTQKTSTPGLTQKHAYAVLAFHPAADTIELWNPHGNNFAPNGQPGLTHGYPTKAGIFTMPVKEFVQQFQEIVFEGPA
ncbi:MAG TPA: C2 family cysteine protease [Verrucomicrobiae bacterium]